MATITRSSEASVVDPFIKMPSTTDMAVSLLAMAVGVFAASYFHSFPIAIGVALTVLPNVINWIGKAIFLKLNPAAGAEAHVAANFSIGILGAAATWNTLSLINPQWTFLSTFKQAITIGLYAVPIHLICGTSAD